MDAGAGDERVAVQRQQRLLLGRREAELPSMHALVSAPPPDMEERVDDRPPVADHVDELGVGEHLLHEPDARPAGVLGGEPALPLEPHHIRHTAAHPVGHERRDISGVEVAIRLREPVEHRLPERVRLVVHRQLPSQPARGERPMIGEPREHRHRGAVGEPPVVLGRPGQVLVRGEQVHHRREPAAAGADHEQRTRHGGGVGACAHGIGNGALPAAPLIAGTP